MCHVGVALVGACAIFVSVASVICRANDWQMTSAEKLEQFVLSGVEGLDKRREKGRCCYGAVYEVELNGVPCIAKRLHMILVSRGQEQKRPVSEEDRRPAIIFTSIYITW